MKNSDSVGILGFSKLFSQNRNDVESTINVLFVRLPSDSTTTSRVVESVLRTGSTVNVDHDLEFVLLGPTDSLVEVRELTGNVRFSGLGFESPVTDRDTNVVSKERRRAEGVSFF